MVRGIKYRLPVVDSSFLDWTHGSYRYIEETFIPELKIAFNEAGYVFRTEEDRYRGLELPGNRVVECVASGKCRVGGRGREGFEGVLVASRRALVSLWKSTLVSGRAKLHAVTGYGFYRIRRAVAVVGNWRASRRGTL
jgi:hypothetical protein